jgi:hypothetical protein
MGSSILGNRRLAVEALREAPESIRIQGVAYTVEGKRCACAVIMDKLRPGRIAPDEGSWKDETFYTELEAILGSRKTVEQIFKLNDARDHINERPKYTFNGIADELVEQGWR